MGANQTLIQKADLAVSNLLNEGGLLVPQQAKQFMEILIEESVLLGMAKTIPMSAPSYEISKLGFTSRVLRPATESTALGKDDRVKPELGKVTLTSKEFVAEARLSYSVVEDNIQNGTFQDLVLRELGKAVARDMEDTIINGDTTSSDLTLAVLDGVLKQATTRVVNAGGVRLSKSVLKQMIQTMPSQFMTGNLAFITSKNAAIDYSDSLANRGTALGDKALTDNAAAEYMGKPVVWIPKFPETIGTSSNKTNVLLCDPKNINVGIQRDIRIETGKDISARQFLMVVTVRYDVKWAHEPAVVKATEVLAAAG